jgi:hypothetical protein
VVDVKVVAVAVFLALGFAFYVFFAPFVGKKLFQYIAMGIYTPLVSEFTLFRTVFFFLLAYFLMCTFIIFSGFNNRDLFSSSWFQSS